MAKKKNWIIYVHDDSSNKGDSFKLEGTFDTKAKAINAAIKEFKLDRPDIRNSHQIVNGKVIRLKLWSK